MGRVRFPYLSLFIHFFFSLSNISYFPTPVFSALKLRYLIQFVTASGGSAGLTSPRKGSGIMDPSVSPPLSFDPKVIARKDPGWEEMLESAVLRWVEVVVEEARAG